MDPEGVAGSVQARPDPWFALQAPASVSLGAVRAGEALGAAALSLEALGGLGSSGAVVIEVEGPFEVVGSRDPLGPRELRRLEVRATGAQGLPRLLSGRARVEVDGHRAEVALSAAILDPKIPDGVRWGHAALGRQAVIAMPSAPFPHRNGPYQDDSVLIFVPDHFTGREGVNVVLHAHGYHARVRDVTPAHALAEQVVLSGRDVVLVAPQGPLMAADMALGKLDKRGGLRRLLEDVVAVLYRDGLAPIPALGEVVLTAHSGGYRGVANMLDAEDVPVKAVHLFDALYSRVSAFYMFGRRGAVVRSSFTWKSATEDDNAQLTRLLASNRVRVGERFTERELRRRRATIGMMRVPHDETVRTGQIYARLLATSGLRPSPLSPPILIATEHEGDKARVRWWSDPGEPARRCVVEGSEDGLAWHTLAEVAVAAEEGVEREALVAPMPWLRVRALDQAGGESLASDRYGATGRRWLIVDGFDRAIDGRWPLPSHGFAAALGNALGEPFSVASHDAVAEGLVKLTDYARVLWFVGDEGHRDLVLDPYEWRLLDAWLDQGGRLIFSGADAAEGLRPDLLANLFGVSLFDGATPAARAAGRPIAALPPLPGFERPDSLDGPDAFNGLDVLDALDGPDVIWSYDGHHGGAAVGRAHRVVFVGFGLENLSDADRAPALSELVKYLK